MKQIEFLSEKTLEEVCNITGNFWQTEIRNATIVEDQYYEEGRIRVMRITTSMSFMSNGEDYHMVFERLNDKVKQTKITISISLKFGWGAQWKKPSDTLKHWAFLVGVEPIDFGTKPFIIFLSIVLGLLALLIIVPIIVAVIFMSIN